MRTELNFIVLHQQSRLIAKRTLPRIRFTPKIITRVLVAIEDTALNYVQATTLVPKLCTGRSVLCASRFRKCYPITLSPTRPEWTERRERANREEANPRQTIEREIERTETSETSRGSRDVRTKHERERSCNRREQNPAVQWGSEHINER